MVKVLDNLTVWIGFDVPTPYPYAAFVGTGTPIISQAQFAECVGEAAESCEEQNTAPPGTGPYYGLQSKRGGGLRAQFLRAAGGGGTDGPVRADLQPHRPPPLVWLPVACT